MVDVVRRECGHCGESVLQGNTLHGRLSLPSTPAVSEAFAFGPAESHEARRTGRFSRHSAQQANLSTNSNCRPGVFPHPGYPSSSTYPILFDPLLSSPPRLASLPHFLPHSSFHLDSSPLPMQPGPLPASASLLLSPPLPFLLLWLHSVVRATDLLPCLPLSAVSSCLRLVPERPHPGPDEICHSPACNQRVITL